MNRVAGAWNRFWFTPEPTSSLALFRIAIGIISLGWALSLVPNFHAFFSSDGVQPAPPTGAPAGIWGVLNTFPAYPVAIGLLVALLVASACVTVGYRTRLASLVVCIAVHSFIQRTPAIWHSGDGVLRILCFFLVFMPAGAALSVDRWRTARDRFWEFPARPRWALRLVQIQVSAIYLSSVWFKITGTGWLDGTAVSYAVRVEDLERFALPGVLTDSILFSALTSYWALAVELLIGILVWNKAARPYVLGLGVALHLLVGFNLRLGLFPETMLASYLVFLSPAAATTVILATRDRLRGVVSRVRAPERVPA
jgi:hypothetical protein